MQAAKRKPTLAARLDEVKAHLDADATVEQIAVATGLAESTIKVYSHLIRVRTNQTMVQRRVVLPRQIDEAVEREAKARNFVTVSFMLETIIKNIVADNLFEAVLGE